MSFAVAWLKDPDTVCTRTIPCPDRHRQNLVALKSVQELPFTSVVN